MPNATIWSTQKTQFRVFVSVLVCLSFVLVCFGQASSPSSPDQLVAEIDGRPVYEKDLVPLVGAQIARLRNQEYEIKSRALDSLIERELLEKEAQKRGISMEQLLQQEVELKIPEPTDGELEAFYLAQQDRLRRPLNEVKEQVAETLRRARIQNGRREYLRTLREKANVTVLLRPLKTEVGFDRSRVRGNPAAPITIVEFSDFQCPFCRNVQGSLREILAKYEGKVKLAFRDFPLREIHARAGGAAEAARCAGEQGKFWEYHDLLFSNPPGLETAKLAEYARNLELDVSKFDSCISDGKYTKEVEEDIREGARLGVTGTPAFFINGVFLSGAQPTSAFEKVIDAELATMRAGNRPPQ